MKNDIGKKILALISELNKRIYLLEKKIEKLSAEVDRLKEQE